MWIICVFNCKVGKNELIMSGNYRNFRKNYSKHRND